MSCLILRLAGPLQSWGGTSKFASRRTLNEPTKGGIVGLLAAAQGRRRTEPIEDLLRIRMGVRTEYPGILMVDYHTISNYTGTDLPTAVTKNGRQKLRSNGKTLLSYRYYLQDAIFLVALEADDSVLLGLRESLLYPYYFLALGRRSCVPTLPIVIDPEYVGLTDLSYKRYLWEGDILQTLNQVPWMATERVQKRAKQYNEPINLRVSYDNPLGTELRNDVPLSFDPQYKQFQTRKVTQTYVTIMQSKNESVYETQLHDPFELIKEE
jgi:CRISPR system Cascade subunit CasD